MDAMNIDLTIEKAMTYFLSHTHTRIPVYSWTIDKIDYFITSRDLIREIRLGNGNKKLLEIRLKEVLKVPLNQSLSMLLESLQKSYKTMAIVVDEYGWVAGLVTIEDIMEEVFWEIRDETDKESEEFIKMWENGLLVESDILIEDVLDKFSLTLTDIWLDEKELGSETLSYIITHVLDRFPKIKETLEFQVNTEAKVGILEVRILELIDETIIWKVEVRFLEKKPEISDKVKKKM
jgi:CBS domain containing-hemolysin-like protein